MATSPITGESPPSMRGDFPHPSVLGDAFTVYEVEIDDGDIRYYGEPLGDEEEVVRNVAPRFRKRGYRVRMNYETGEYVLVATERSLSVDGIPWTNVVLFLATVVTTLFAGAQWYGIPVAENPISVVYALPFTLSVLGVLAVHELGHYVLSRRHEVEATLPYFIPIPNALGTFGAVIRMKDTIPDRDALFDIGVAGPLAGLAATVVVTAVGVSLPPVEVGASSIITRIELGYPLLIQGIAAVLGQPLVYDQPGVIVNPVVIGGWVGCLVTLLNLMPVGQLDGAHVTRAVIGDRIGTVQKLVPAFLFGLAGYLTFFGDGRAAGIWVFWGILVLIAARFGSATPVDESPVGSRRRAVAVLTLVLGALCFTPVPIVITG
ncbi:MULTISPECIES: site-2 protease family protein [Salinibaculum]|uniref:site-2 protease family protein n=1 Tax=Salinibaculum TaxID=2732368 RepID=UPI003612D123